jgi:hypothetical protein
VSPEGTAAIFVNVSPPLEGGGCFAVVPSPLDPQRNICSLQDKFIKQFFSGFMVRNDLDGELDLDTITSSFQKSPSLYNAVLALGASDASRGSGSASFENGKVSMSFALKAYRTSIVKFQEEIANKSVLQTESSLWTTFFLGLFEVGSHLTVQNLPKTKLQAAHV